MTIVQNDEFHTSVLLQTETEGGGGVEEAWRRGVGVLIERGVYSRI